MKIRVHDLREKRALATAAVVFFGVLTAGVMADVVPLGELLHIERYWSLALPMAAWSASFLLVRPGASRLLPTDGIQDFALFLRAGGVIDVHIARGAVGYSLVVSTARDRDAHGWILEVESEREARAVCEKLGVAWPGTDTTVAVPHPVMRTLRIDLALTAAACALLYGLVVGSFHDSDFKAWFGVPAVVGATLVTVLFFLEPFFRRVLEVGRQPLRGASIVADHLRLHITADELDRPSAEARVDVLDRKGETLAAWLARIDALGAAGVGYRGDSFTPDELREAVEDHDAPVGARLGALRLLSRRGVVPTEVRTRIADDLGMERVRIVVEGDAEEAAAELESEGPVFLGRMERHR